MVYFKDENQYYFQPYTPVNYNNTGVNTNQQTSLQDALANIEAEKKARADLVQQQLQSLPIPPSTMGGREGNNILQNVGQDFKDIVTGGAYMLTHPKEAILQPLGREIVNIGQAGVEGFKNPELNKYVGTNPDLMDRIYGSVTGATSKAGKDLVDFLITNYDITTDDIAKAIKGEGSKKALVQKALKSAGEHPLFTGLDVASLLLPGLKAIKGSSKAAQAAKAGTRTAEQITEELSKMSPAQRVATQINMTGAEANKNANKFLDISENIKKGYSQEQIEKAIEAHMGGFETTEVPKDLLKKVGESIQSYDDMLTQENKYAEVLSKEDKFAISDTQATQYKGKDLGLNKNFDDIKRERQPYYDKIQNVEIVEKEIDHPTKGKIKVKDRIVTPRAEGWKELEEMAQQGDNIAQDILSNKKQFDKGYLRIVPMAEISGIETFGKSIGEGRVVAGRASDRVYGTATPKQIAETYFMKPNEWINNKVNQVIEKEVINEIATKGTLGNTPLVTESTKKVKYINPTHSTIDSIVETATDTATNVNTVAIDSNLLKEVQGQTGLLKGGNNPFAQGSGLADVFNVIKGNALASGGYLAGNAETALYNAFLNAGLNPIGFAQDAIDAWRSNNELIKRANSYRRLSPVERNIKNPIIKGINKWSGTGTVSNALNYIDTKIQNTAAEMAAHRNLRERGVKFEDRARALEDMDKLSLAQTANDIQTVALMNKTNTLVPRALHQAWAATNPFWRWTDTALQSTYYMMDKHPVATNIIWNKLMGSVMFDKEMQNRMNLDVQSDKPFVSYRYNPQTKTLQEVSAEFMPVMNSVKFFGETAEALKAGDGAKAMQSAGLFAIPFITKTSNVLMGKDQYGRPLINGRMNKGTMSVNYQTGDRYIMTPEGWKLQNAGLADEVLGTLVEEAAGSLRFLNKAAIPTAVSTYNALTGKDKVYYQPYQTDAFQLGSITNAGEMPRVGNPRRASNELQVADYFLGRYARDYNPQFEARQNMPLDAQERKSIMRGIMRFNTRTNEILRNRGGY